MTARQELAGLRHIKGIQVSAFVLLAFTVYRPDVAVGQAKQPSRLFRPALDQIQARVNIPILLPTKLPSGITDESIKLVRGEVTTDGYRISLYFSEDGNASYAAGFSGSTTILTEQDLANTRRVSLSGGLIGMFTPVSCGGSCAPANIWWEQNGVMYQIQVKLGPGSDIDQERILVATANSMVTVRRR